MVSWWAYSAIMWVDRSASETGEPRSVLTASIADDWIRGQGDMMARKPPTRDDLPLGMTAEHWDDLEEMIRDVLWLVGENGEPISYMALCLRLEGVPLHHRSIVLTGLLNEIALDEQDRGARCWVTAFIVLSGRKYSGAGFFKMVAEHERRWTGKTKFCDEQRRRAQRWMREHLRSETAAA